MISVNMELSPDVSEVTSAVIQRIYAQEEKMEVRRTHRANSLIHQFQVWKLSRA
jgi:hypothetical protein